jgi:lysophospholipase L1-like esterase
MSHPRPISRIGLHVIVTLLVATLLSACNHMAAPSTTTPGPPAAGSPIVYTAIGASDATGHGSSVPCDIPFTPCPNGMGYVYVATRTLQAQGFTVTLLNLGLPTAVIGPDFEALGTNNGRTIAGNFITFEMPVVNRNSTVVTIFAGGNEVNTITAALGHGAGASDPTGYIDNQVRAFGADYSTLLAGIRALAGNPRIVALNVPNLAGLPLLAAATLLQKQAAQRASVGMTTTVVNALTAQGIVVIDLMCDPRTYLASNYSSDGFHPNDAGYAFIASEVVRAITSSSYPAPQNSCSPMTLVP